MSHYASYHCVQYLELDGVGHCPHHEAPNATNLAVALSLQHMAELAAWQQASASAESGTDASPTRPQPPLAVGQRVEVVEEPDGRLVVVEHTTGGPRSLTEFLSHASWNAMEALQVMFGGGSKGAGVSLG